MLDEIENEVKQKERFLNDQAKKYVDMKEKYTWLVEYKYVLEKTKEIREKNVAGVYANSL